MVKDSVSARYASALFDLAKAQGRLDAAARDLAEIAALIRAHGELRRLLLNPDVEIDDKLGVLDRLLGGDWSADVRAFVRLVLSFDRAAQLVEMADAFGELLDAERRVVRVTVRSAHPIAPELRARLVAWIEARERSTVALAEEVDSQLIGGLQVLLDHRIFDGSVKTQLGTLRQRLGRVRVH